MQNTVDPDVLQRFDTMVDNRSEALERLMRKFCNMESVEDEELVNRLSQIEEELESIQSDMADLQDRKSTLESERDAIKLTLEKAEEEEDVLSDALPVLIDKYEEKRRKHKDHKEALNQLTATETYHMWLDKVDLDSSELKNRITEEVKS
jgi:chromosome segregation ATPase